MSPMVAPLAGAWIEMETVVHREELIKVAPLAGVWIEMSLSEMERSVAIGRPPRGGVD